MSEITISDNKGKKKFKCGKCDKSFPQKFHMERHEVVVHNEKKTFKSKICDKRFKSQMQLKCKTKIAKSRPATIVEPASDTYPNTEFLFDLNDEPSASLPDPLAPNVLVEVNTDISDPLAMPDPMELQIKTEVIDDEPLAMEDSMITDDPFTNPDAGDIKIETTKLSSDPNSTSSLEIEEHNPIPDSDLDGALADPFETVHDGKKKLKCVTKDFLKRVT